MEKYNFESIVEVLKEIISSAGRYLIEKTGDTISVKKKTSFKDLVTDLDTEIQTFIMNQIEEKYSGACFIAEEIDNNDEDLYSELTFIIDPIDGTANFIKDMKYSCISISCFSLGEPMVGVVYNPYANEMFWAVKGQGAYLNNKPINVQEVHIGEALVLFGTSPYDDDTIENTFEKLKKIYIKCLDIRRMGSAALDICSVACGRAGLYFEGKLALWDYAAASIILSESGGTICDYSGNSLIYSLKKTSVITGSKLIIEESNLLRKN